MPVTAIEQQVARLPVGGNLELVRAVGASEHVARWTGVLSPRRERDIEQGSVEPADRDRHPWRRNETGPSRQPVRQRGRRGAGVGPRFRTCSVGCVQHGIGEHADFRVPVRTVVLDEEVCRVVLVRPAGWNVIRELTRARPPEWPEQCGHERPVRHCGPREASPIRRQDVDPRGARVRVRPQPQETIGRHVDCVDAVVSGATGQEIGIGQ